MTPPPLHAAINQTFIIAHTENTDALEAVLRDEGLPCEVMRQVWQEAYRAYSRSQLALFNHRRAWERAAAAAGLTLIVEADFVPVRHLGMLPLPFPSEQMDMGITWLYTCAPQIYSVSQTGHAQGFSTAMVAYLLTPASAHALVEMAEAIAQTTPPDTYLTWDSGIEEFLRKRGFKNFVPFRNYGEHGGRPNPEHQRHGLSRMHRADVLYGSLAFLPPYALAEGDECSLGRSVSLNDRIRYLWVRAQARMKGLGRLFLGKFLRWPIVRQSSVPHWLLSFAIRRQLSLLP